MIDAHALPLDAVCHIQAGHPFRGTIECTAGGDVLALQMKDVDAELGIGWSGAVRTRLAGRKEPAWLQASDLLFVSKGARFYAVLVDTPPMPSVCGPTFFHLRVQPGASAEPAFLAWQMNQPPFQRLLMQSAEGSAQLSIRRPLLASLPVALPSPEDQRRIVGLDVAARAERALLRGMIRNRELQLNALAEALSAAPAGQPHHRST